MKHGLVHNVVSLFIICCYYPLGTHSFQSIIKHKTSFHLTPRLEKGQQTRSTSAPSSTQLYGIPKMFRWLTDQYPAINRRLSEGLTPNTIVDNFYLDMNGIIHPCTHGNRDTVVVLDEKAMFQKIFGYVDRLYKLVKPRNVMYLAVDGVAPRAKINQQRSRRFRSGKEAEALAADMVNDKAMDDYVVFDSNCITPGTDFMMKLSLAMEKWIEYKIKTDPFWANGATIMFSGPDVPGEGEHKVMDYIREIQAENEGVTDLRHVLYGLDADLIMLGLVTHEPNFTLLREKMSVVMAGRNSRNKKKKIKDMLEYDRNDYELLELKVLRQMLSMQFRKLVDVIPDYNPERVIDDFVFLCALVGNDFLPHTPHLEIDGGALNLMMSTYIDLLPTWKGYLTDKEKINPDRFEQFIFDVANYEEEFFKRRSYEENEPGWALPIHEEEFDIEEKMIVSKFTNKQKQDPESESADKANKKLPPSYRTFYYETKLHNSTIDFRREHVKDYLEGLHWVLEYYHNGCAAWNWYFPHLYSPLATDMVYLRDFYHDNEGDDEEKKEGTEAEFISLPFDIGKPIPSLAQLLSVLPSSSASLLPQPLAELMINPSSPIAQFYPNEFTTDPNGKRQTWEAIVRIPFVDEGLILQEVDRIIKHSNNDDSKDNLLNEREKRRNVVGVSKAFVPPNAGRRNHDDEFDGNSGDGGGETFQLKRKGKVKIGATTSKGQRKKSDE